MRELKNKVAIITGAAGALGTALAARFAAEGMRLVLADVDAAALASTEKTLKACGAQVVSSPVDVSQLHEVKALAELALSAWGAAHVVCNNAGVAPLGPVWETTVAEWDWVLGVNLKGVIHGMQVFTPLLLAQNEGHILNTASVAAEDGQIGQVAYTASKAGVVGITLVVARDLSNEGVRCNTILPGIFDTPLLARAPDNVKAALAASVPFPKRLGRPEEYAQVAHTMITCGYLNGEDVRVDGAIRMAPR